MFFLAESFCQLLFKLTTKCCLYAPSHILIISCIGQSCLQVGSLSSKFQNTTFFFDLVVQDTACIKTKLSLMGITVSDSVLAFIAFTACSIFFLYPCLAFAGLVRVIVDLHLENFLPLISLREIHCSGVVSGLGLSRMDG